jgi:ERCC4-related helicase
VLHQQPEGQLQTQHKGRQNNKYKKNNNNQIIRNYMAVERVNTQIQLVIEYINIYGIIIKLNYVKLVTKRRKLSKQLQANKILN